MLYLVMIYVGTAGWSIPRESAGRCLSAGTHLERYARELPCAEINSSFYRPHKQATYAKWAASTPEQFRFAVKVPKLITHEQRLRRSRAPFEQFLHDVSGLGHRLGPLLVQLPPSFAFDARVAGAFFAMARERHDGAMVCEPRHPTWFSANATDMLKRHAIGRVAADPSSIGEPEAPGDWSGIAYFRLHGSPRMYWSRYDDAFISQLASRATSAATAAIVWCIFDNTATGSAIENAFELKARLNSLNE
jgi:uncharacterized protein YecE (DUF72 family)